MPTDPAPRFLDIGSGLGGLLAHLARACPTGQFVGVETAPLPFVLSRARLGSCSNATVRWGDFWNTDLSEHNVVFAYLSPVPMAQLWEKVRREMRPGSMFISYRFSVPGVTPTEIHQLADLGCTQLYVWRL